ncbi:hypothetical protein C8Q78DRAFT_764740 [Trametes maxima]|nr:hypothetical protein C8Q78DRAFT_764740 [Trametes maxima]
MTHFCEIPQRPSNIQINTVFGRVFTPILTARFITHLRRTEPEYDDCVTLPTLSLHFRSTPTPRFPMSVVDPMNFDADWEGDDVFYSDDPTNTEASRP